MYKSNPTFLPVVGLKIAATRLAIMDIVEHLRKTYGSSSDTPHEWGHRRQTRSLDPACDVCPIRRLRNRLQRTPQQFLRTVQNPFMGLHPSPRFHHSSPSTVLPSTDGFEVRPTQRSRHTFRGRVCSWTTRYAWVPKVDRVVEDTSDGSAIAIEPPRAQRGTVSAPALPAFTDSDC